MASPVLWVDKFKSGIQAALAMTFAVSFCIAAFLNLDAAAALKDLTILTVSFWVAKRATESGRTE